MALNGLDFFNGCLRSILTPRFSCMTNQPDYPKNFPIENKPARPNHIMELNTFRMTLRGVFSSGRRRFTTVHAEQAWNHVREFANGIVSGKLEDPSV